MPLCGMCGISPNKEKNKIRTNSIGDMPLYGISPNNNNNEEKNKIRTNSIGDMPLYGISPDNDIGDRQPRKNIRFVHV